jgi:hypothetical protein
VQVFADLLEKRTEGLERKEVFGHLVRVIVSWYVYRGILD